MVLLTVAALGGWGVGCRGGSDDWQTLAFEPAGLTFSVPGNWSVRYREGSDAPRPLDPQPDDPRAQSPLRDAAILTALPVLEDAALVIIAPRLELPPETFAAELHNFIPLSQIKYNHRMLDWGVGGLKGYAFDGTGKLESADGGLVHFRSLVLTVSGKPVIITLYAEDERHLAYGALFDRIIKSLAPTVSSAAAPEQPARPDAGAESSESPPPAPVEQPPEPAPPAPLEQPDSGSMSPP